MSKRVKVRRIMRCEFTRTCLLADQCPHGKAHYERRECVSGCSWTHGAICKPTRAKLGGTTR
jgi:hypothetical protein